MVPWSWDLERGEHGRCWGPGEGGGGGMWRGTMEMGWGVSQDTSLHLPCVSFVSGCEKGLPTSWANAFNPVAPNGGGRFCTFGNIWKCSGCPNDGWLGAVVIYEQKPGTPLSIPQCTGSPSPPPLPPHIHSKNSPGSICRWC